MKVSSPLGSIGIEVYFTVTVLTTSTRLFCVLAIHIHSLCEGLLVSNLGSAHIGLYLELTKKTVNDDLKMQLAHTGDDGLASLFVGMNTEGGILLCQLY